MGMRMRSVYHSCLVALDTCMDNVGGDAIVCISSSPFARGRFCKWPRSPTNALHIPCYN